MAEPAQYAAFLSYSHRDKRWASWLHRALETYRIPTRLYGTGEMRQALRPIFRDRDELAASPDLSERIEAALANSRVLIVLCSPSAARSRWTNAEIATFKRLHPDRPVLAAIVEGEPYASEIEGREDEEAFPPALRFQVDATGALTDQRAEPIAADFRADSDGKRLGKLKIIAGMLGLGLNELVRRETVRRNRQLAMIAAGSLAGMALTSGLAIFAFRQRAEAVHQREQADGLIEFMLTDLRKKLEPLGRLDVLDSVGEKALRYYASQKIGDLDADALGRRARALQLVGEVSNSRGNLDGALTLFQQAAATTAEQLRRDPDNGQRIFDHAQSVYWVGYIAWQRGDTAGARRGFIAYRDYAARLSTLEGASPAWRAELGHANINLGVLELDDGKPEPALRYFEAARAVWSGLHRQVPDSREYAFAEAQALAWQADARRGLGDYAGALADRQREIAAYTALLGVNGSDSQASEGLAMAWLRTAQIQLELGDPRKAVELAGRSLDTIKTLEAQDPSNSLWQEMAVKSANMRAEALMMTRDWTAAREINALALDRARRLVAKDASVASWRSECLMPARWMEIAIGRALSGGGTDAASVTARTDRFLADFPQPVAIKSEDERFARIMVPTMAGLDWRRLGDPAKAKAAFQRAAALLPPAGAQTDARFAALASILGDLAAGRAPVRAAAGTGTASDSELRAVLLAEPR